MRVDQVRMVQNRIQWRVPAIAVMKDSQFSKMQLTKKIHCIVKSVYSSAD